ncbi:MAG TPA: hypothetical protein V6D23_02335 [Candidatus Obscuribacterales bacterium]
MPNIQSNPTASNPVPQASPVPKPEKRTPEAGQPAANPDRVQIKKGAAGAVGHAAAVEFSQKHYDRDAILIKSARAMLEAGGIRLGAFQVRHPVQNSQDRLNPPQGDLQLVGNGFELSLFDHTQSGREAIGNSAGDIRVAGQLYDKSIDFAYWDNSLRGPGAANSNGKYHLSMQMGEHVKHLRDMDPIIPSPAQQKTALLADAAVALVKRAGFSVKDLHVTENAAPGERGDISLVGSQARLNVFDNLQPNRNDNQYGNLHLAGEIQGHQVDISYWENDGRGLDAIQSNGRFHLQVNVDGVTTHTKSDKGLL